MVLRLSGDTVVVVTVRLDEAPVRHLLDEEERRRADRFVYEKDRRRFIVAHAAMRAVLAAYLDVAPASLRFSTKPRGKPFLMDAPLDVRFNLSHSGELALLAVTLSREVGVDIEERHCVDALDLAEQVFSPSERERLRQTPSHQRLEVFFRGWTRKESFIKALGDGVSFPLAGFDVSLEPDGPQLLLTCRAAPRETRRWTLRTLPGEPGYAAAITVEGGDFAVLSCTYPDMLG